MDGRELRVLHEAFGKDDSVFVVVAAPAHECDFHVLAERELAAIGRGGVGQEVAALHLIANVHGRTVIEAGKFVRHSERLEAVFVLLPFLVLDDDVLRIGCQHGAGVLRVDEASRVARCHLFDTSRDDRRFRDDAGRRLFLHVRTHQGAVRVVILDERDHGGRDGEHLVRRDVHVFHFLAGDEDGLAVEARLDVVIGELAVSGERDRGMRDGMLRFFEGVQKDDLIGHLATDDLRVRRLDDAEIVDARVRRETEDESDVLAFRSLYRAEASVVRGVHVAHLEARAFAGEAAGTERRYRAKVLELIEDVLLGRELGELVRREEFLYGGCEGARIHELGRERCLDIDRGHLVLDVALHARKADADARFKQLADLAHAAETEVVDVIAFRAGRVIELDDMGNDEDDVVERERADIELFLIHRAAEALVEAVTARVREIVALGGEDALHVFARRIRRREVAVAQAPVDLYICLLRGLRGILLQGRLDGGLPSRYALEKGQHVAIERRAEDAEQGRHGELALTVDLYEDRAVGFRVDLDPCAARRDDLRTERDLAAHFTLREKDAERARELRHDDTLDAVYDERAVLGHYGEIREEDGLLLLRGETLVREAHVRLQWRVVCELHLLSSVFVDLRLAELERNELKLEFLLRVVDDRRELLEEVLKALRNKGTERGDLGCDQVRHRDAGSAIAGEAFLGDRGLSHGARILKDD